VSQGQRQISLSTVQSLRGFAALAVCASHLHSIELKFDPTPLLGNWAITGFGGVDLFFVISGFVMVWVTRASQGVASAVPTFWLMRALRIYPLWWLVLSALVVVWMIKPDWVFSSVAGEPDLLRSYLLFPAVNLPLHAVGWTLIHEMWFYIVFGFVLMVPRRFVPACLALWAGVVIAAALALPNPADPVLSLLRHPLTLEFIAGAAIALLATKRALPLARIVLQAGCFFLLLAAIFIRDNAATAFADEWTRIGLFGLPCAMILWGWVGMEQAGGGSPLWSQGLGNWSYALYLIHVPVFALVGRLAKPFSIPGPIDNIALLIVALALAILAAFVLHEALEKPMQRLSRNWLKRPG
jgi:exopolysaccharide production protein ExoZ